MTNPTFEDGFTLFSEGTMIQASVQEVSESEQQLVGGGAVGDPQLWGCEAPPSSCWKLKAFFFLSSSSFLCFFSRFAAVLLSSHLASSLVVASFFGSKTGSSGENPAVLLTTGTLNQSNISRVPVSL